MTYPAQTPKNVVVCNGVQTVFAYTFGVPVQPDNTNDAMAVFLIVPGTPTTIIPLVNNVDYTLSAIGNQTGGNLTSQGTHSPFANGAILWMGRALDLAQDTTFPNQGFLPTDIEASLDQMTQAQQQLSLPDLTKVVTVANLPAANLHPFERWFVLDATAFLFGTSPTGGGSLSSPVYSDGQVWRMG